MQGVSIVAQPPKMARSMSIVSRMRHASASTASAWPCAMKISTVALDEEYHRSARRAIPALAPSAVGVAAADGAAQVSESLTHSYLNPRVTSTRKQQGNEYSRPPVALSRRARTHAKGSAADSVGATCMQLE